MEKIAEALSALSLTLAKYDKNKTLVPKSELEGKYKKAYEKLKNQLEDDIRRYMTAVVFDGIKLATSDYGMFINKFNSLYEQKGYSRRIGTAAFKDLNLQAIQNIVSELRSDVCGLFNQYMDKHICLCITDANMAPESTEKPIIFNDITNAYWNYDKKEWCGFAGTLQNGVLVYLDERKN